MQPSILFEDKSDLYASSRPLYPDTLFEYIASLVKNHKMAWDCATGNGQAAMGLAGIFDSVEATDISKNQISNAFKKPNIEFSVQSAENTCFRENQFDLVNVAQALHWFDLDTFWDEVRRVLKSGGLFITYSYAWSMVNEEIDRMIDLSLRNVIKPYWSPQVRLCWDGYKTVRFPFKMIDCPEFEITNNWDLDQYFKYMHTWSATRRCMDDMGTGFFEDIKKQVSEIWGLQKEKKLIKTPLTVIAGYNEE